jgi:hypothetical protein
MIDRTIEISRCEGMETKVEKTKARKSQATIPSTDYDRPKSTGECRIFRTFELYDNK